MVGITLSPEQIRSAPGEVRRWLEGQIALSLGLQPSPRDMPRGQSLISLSPSEAVDVFGLIEKTLPAVHVFFELGRLGESVGQEDIEAYSLTDMMHHAHLETMEQLLACLQTINDATRYVRRESEGQLCLLDRRGYCLVAAETQRSVFRLWKQIVAQHEDSTTRVVGTQTQPNSSLQVSGVIPPAALHMTGFGASTSESPPKVLADGAGQMEGRAVVIV